MVQDPDTVLLDEPTTAAIAIGEEIDEEEFIRTANPTTTASMVQSDKEAIGSAFDPESADSPEEKLFPSMKPETDDMNPINTEDDVPEFETFEGNNHPIDPEQDYLPGQGRKSDVVNKNSKAEYDGEKEKTRTKVGRIYVM